MPSCCLCSMSISSGVSGTPLFSDACVYPGCMELRFVDSSTLAKNHPQNATSQKSEGYITNYIYKTRICVSEFVRVSAYEVPRPRIKLASTARRGFVPLDPPGPGEEP